MGKYWESLRTREQRLLLRVNRGPFNEALNNWLGIWLRTVTHLGGASFTLGTSLLAALLAPGPWRLTGWQCLIAVAISHLPVALVKRKFKRLRPYQALAGVRPCRKPLQDSSFPSGHTTAVFAWLLPILLTPGAPAPLLLPAALLLGLSVAWSRMFLGLHYPSDVAAGALLGSASSLALVLLFPF